MVNEHNRDLETNNRLAAIIIGFVEQRPEYTREVLRRQAEEREVGDNADDACGDAYLSQATTFA